ncbi:MAG: GlsB/YeaQ/YmgE family stress response membrane protein [Acidobacteria bacterium]|nr:GlsB/YeaQ/YmgE family stress response membrane protein [Acidobacteriota bacterium]
MNLIVQLVVGGIIGWLASMVMKTNAQMGVIANVAVGIVGSVIGGYLATALNMGGSGFLSVFFSIIGASILIFLLKAIGVFK